MNGTTTDHERFIARLRRAAAYGAPIMAPARTGMSLRPSPRPDFPAGLPPDLRLLDVGPPTPAAHARVLGDAGTRDSR